MLISVDISVAQNKDAILFLYTLLIFTKTSTWSSVQGQLKATADTRIIWFATAELLLEHIKDK